MPTRPTIKPQTKQLTSVGILRSIFNDPNNDLLYGQLKVDNTTESIRAAGEYITSFVPRANQFINSLVNRIGMVRVQYLIWNNPWTWAKQGKLELGETVEQIWIGLAKAYHYNPEESETRFLKQQKPDVKSAFHSINYQTFYKVTIRLQDLKQAFLSVDGLSNFVESVIGSLGRAANVDEFMMMKYVLAITLLNGEIPTQVIPAVTKANADDVVTTIATTTNNFQFPLASKAYTRAGNENTVAPENIMILESTDVNALLKVNSLANAFNVEYVKFMGNVVMHDGLGNFDWNRMNDILGEDPGYVQFTETQINMLNSVKLIAMDRQFMQIYDNYEYMGEPLRNGEGLFENYFYHVGKILSTSPFHACIAFTTTSAGTITIAVSPTTASVSPGQSVALTATISSTGFDNLDVTWSTNVANTVATISQDGVLRVSADATAETVIKVTVTSVADPTKTAVATITVA